MKYLHWSVFCLALCLTACGPAEGAGQTSAAMNSALKTGGLNSTTDLFLREAHQADAECLELRQSFR